MSFFLSPIKFVFELIGFLISAAFVYGLVMIAAVTIIWYGISTMKEPETIIETVTVVEMHEVTRFVEKGPELICRDISGCRLFSNAKTDKEYCPTCIIK